MQNGASIKVKSLKARESPERVWQRLQTGALRSKTLEAAQVLNRVCKHLQNEAAAQVKPLEAHQVPSGVCERLEGGASISV